MVRANSRAAMPGWSGTPLTVTLASEVSCTTAETMACSMDGSSSCTQVPGSQVNAERTCSRTPQARSTPSRTVRATASRSSVSPMPRSWAPALAPTLSTAFATLINTLNIAYEEEETRGFVRLNLVAFLFTILSLYSTARSQHAEYLIVGSLLLSLSTLVGITEVLTVSARRPPVQM